MSDTAVSLLTAPGTGAIATVEVRGPRAYPLARELFRPAGKPLPEAPEVSRFYFGTLGADEVVLAATDADAVEVHCHGGRRVVRWVIEQFTSRGAEERTPDPEGARAFELLQRAPTLRTASILLDQLNGAFANEVRRALSLLLGADFASAGELLQRLVRLSYSVGWHLVEPWKVIIAGPPNVGKSALLNALAGYQRSVVSETPGTTRDAVRVRVAFDGWPFELIDTAGLRTAQGLEAEGIELGVRTHAEADLLLWVLDLSDPAPVQPDLRDLRNALPEWCLIHTVANKRDREWKWDPKLIRGSENRQGALPVSAATGEGIGELVRTVVDYLIPECPPGAAVPYTDRLVRLVCETRQYWNAGRRDDVVRLLREALAAAE
ncbi:MAG: 50S ribosome-binding GTPase [Planctomycetes bacterium]|nr:50S ribosome-binding GTPase [Planctomycetota bacterium]